MKKMLRINYNNPNVNDHSRSKKIDENFFRLDKSTSEFMKIMNKYKKQTYSPEKNLHQQRTSELMKAIDKTRLNLEKDEKDSAYILKEVKYTVMQNKELENLYGTRAKKQFHEIKNMKNNMKLDKSIFFIETFKNKPIRKIVLFKNTNQDNIITLPSISGRPNLEIYDILNRNRKSSINSQNFNTINNNLTHNRNKISFFSPLKSKNKDFETISTDKKKTNYLSNYNDKINKKFGYNTIEKDEIKNNKPLLLSTYESDQNIFTRPNINFSCDKFGNGFINGRESARKKLAPVDRKYLNGIENFKDELIFERQKKQNYFDRHDYGCRLSKVKYKFLMGKYFESDLSTE